MVAYCTHGSRLPFFHLTINYDNYSTAVHVDLIHLYTLHFIKSVKYFIVDIPQFSNQSPPIDDLLDYISRFLIISLKYINWAAVNIFINIHICTYTYICRISF